MKKKKKTRITKNNIELLKIISKFRYMPFKIFMGLSEIKKMYSFRQSLHLAVLKMEKKALIGSFSYGNNEKVVYLTALGASILSDCISEKIFAPDRKKKIRYGKLEHTYEISKILTRIFDNFNVINWYGDQRIFCKYEFTDAKTSKKIERNLIPDSFFLIESEKKSTSFFLEYDTGEMDISQLAAKFKRYFEYFSYGNWKDKFEKFPNIFFLTDAPEKFLSSLTKPVGEELNTFILQRDKFIKSRNIIYRGIGLTDNIRSMNSQTIRDYLNLNFIFTYTYKPWIEELKKHI